MGLKDAAMKTLKQLQQYELRNSLVCLAKACPVEEGNPDDCILFSVRKMKASARWQWFKTMGPEGLTFLAAYHHVCMGNKLAVRLGQDREADALGPVVKKKPGEAPRPGVGQNSP